MLELEIDTYGISVTTLEEVFLNLARLIGDRMHPENQILNIDGHN